MDNIDAAPESGLHSQGNAVVARLGIAGLVAALSTERDVRKCLRRYTQNEQEIDDLCQETCARVLNSLQSAPQQIDCIKAFFLRTARNVAIDRSRHGRVITEHALAELQIAERSIHHENPEAMASAQEEAARILKAVRSLPWRQRMALRRRKMWGHSHQQIASHMKIDVGTVEKLISRGLHRLHQTLNSESASDPAGRLLFNVLKRHHKRRRNTHD